MNNIRYKYISYSYSQTTIHLNYIFTMNDRVEGRIQLHCIDIDFILYKGA